MRSTIHLVTEDDALVLRAFTQPTIDRSLRGVWAKRLEGIDLAELAAEVRRLVGEAPRTPTELIGSRGCALARARSAGHLECLRAVVPLVQVPPRGVWRRSGAVKLAALDAWLVGSCLDGRPEPIVFATWPRSGRHR